MNPSFPALRPQVHGHRGCRGLLPENTLPAFVYAIELGVDALELDVVLSADHQVVVAHEPWLSAKLGFSPTGQPIDPGHERDFNLYEMPYRVIRQSVVGTLPYAAFPEQRMLPTYRPLLTEALEVSEAACQQLGRRQLLYSIEIKSTPETEGIFHPSPAVFVAEVLKNVPPHLLPRVTFLSFDERILQAIRQADATLRVCLLVEQEFVIPKLFDKLGFVPNAFGPDYRLLNDKKVAQLKESYPKLEVVPWTINDAVDIAKAIAWQVTGITTDYPNRILTSVTL